MSPRQRTRRACTLRQLGWPTQRPQDNLFNGTKFVQLKLETYESVGVNFVRRPSVYPGQVACLVVASAHRRVRELRESKSSARDGICSSEQAMKSLVKKLLLFCGFRGV